MVPFSIKKKKKKKKRHDDEGVKTKAPKGKGMPMMKLLRNPI